MSEIITFPLPLGPNYTIPDVGDENWGQEVTNFLVAIPNGVMPTQGSFALTGDVSLGATYGLVAAHFISGGSNPALTGFLRLDTTDTLSWRNNANTADLPLGINGSDLLTFNGVTMGFSGGVGTANQYQLAYYAVTGNSVAGLTLITASKALVSDTNGLPIASTVTSTELSYVSGVTSAIQTQLNSISTVANAALPETGGTMSGAIAMGSNKITGLANGTNPQDAATYSQVTGVAAFQSGDLKAAAYSAVPSGWLLCDGTSYPTATYPTLFAAIGYTWGGSGANFNVPNAANNVLIGAGSIAALGASAGSSTVTVVQNSHNHTQNGHDHEVPILVNNSGGVYVSQDRFSVAGDTTTTATNFSVGSSAGSQTAVDGYLSQTVTPTNNATTATNQASSTIQPVIGVTWFIKI